MTAEQEGVVHRARHGRTGQGYSILLLGYSGRVFSLRLVVVPPLPRFMPQAGIFIGYCCIYSFVDLGVSLANLIDVEI